MTRLQEAPRHGRLTEISDVWIGAAVVPVLAIVLRIVYGGGAIGYDASFALVWGSQIAHGHVPEFHSSVAPTPHPLANLVSVPLSLLGHLGVDAVMAISFLSLAALTWFGYLFAARLFTPWVGALFGVLLVTRPALVNETLQALVDLPFLALVAAAAAIAVGPRRNDRLVLLLLSLGGLLRPEGWPLALGYALLVWRSTEPGERLTLAALALSAPIIWFVGDALVTGDPLYSLHGTQSLAAELDRPRGTGSAIVAAPQYLRTLLLPTVAWLGLAGALVALALLYEEAAPVAGVATLGLLGFIVLGTAGLPVLTRYLLIPACILALFAAVAALGWTKLPHDSAVRRPWMFASIAAAILLLIGAADARTELAATRTFLSDRGAVHEDLRTVLASPAGKRAVARCRRVVVPEHRPVPLVAYALERKPSAIGQSYDDLTRGDAYLAFARPTVARELSLSSPEPPAPPGAPPAFAKVAQNRSWTLYTNCG